MRLRKSRAILPLCELVAVVPICPTSIEAGFVDATEFFGATTYWESVELVRGWNEGFGKVQYFGLSYIYGYWHSMDIEDRRICPCITIARVYVSKRRLLIADSQTQAIATVPYIRTIWICVQGTSPDRVGACLRQLCP